MQPTSTRPSARTFFVVTYLLSWTIWIPLVLSHFGIGALRISEATSQIVRLAGVLMPAVAAMLLTRLRGGSPALRDLLGRLGLWRVGWRWWVAAVLVQPAMVLLVAAGYNVAGGVPAVTPLAAVPFRALAVNIIFLALATLGEEIGWRGVALPALQDRHRALPSSIILGFVWAAWHIPFWLLLDTYDTFGVAYLVLSFLLIVPSTVYISWFFNHSRASLLLPVAFHLTFNIVNVAWLPVTTNLGAFGMLIAVEWFLAGLLLRRLEPG